MSRIKLAFATTLANSVIYKYFITYRLSTRCHINKVEMIIFYRGLFLRSLKNDSDKKISIESFIIYSYIFFITDIK